MANIMSPPSYDYEGWRAVLNGKGRRKIGHNTYVELDEDGDEPIIRILYHYTYIASFHRDGIIELNTNGWETSTTKQRINSVLPTRYGIFQHKHVWFLTDRRESGQDVTYHDKMRLHTEHGVLAKV